MIPKAIKDRVTRIVKGSIRYGPTFAVEVALFGGILWAVDISGYGSPTPTTRPGFAFLVSGAFVVLAMGAAEARFHLYRRVWSVAGLSDAFAIGLAVVEASL